MLLILICSILLGSYSYGVTIENHIRLEQIKPFIQVTCKDHSSFSVPHLLVSYLPLPLLWCQSAQIHIKESKFGVIKKYTSHKRKLQSQLILSLSELINKNFNSKAFISWVCYNIYCPLIGALQNLLNTSTMYQILVPLNFFDTSINGIDAL